MLKYAIWHVSVAALTFNAHCCHMGTAIKHPVPRPSSAVICNF